MIQVPRWVLENMFETLRMCDTVYNISKRESCLHRNMMRDWHHISDLLKDGKINSENNITYYMGNPKIPTK